MTHFLCAMTQIRDRQRGVDRLKLYGTMGNFPTPVIRKSSDKISETKKEPWWTKSINLKTAEEIGRLLQAGKEVDMHA